jgi:CheY-like chemotaxis protein
MSLRNTLRNFTPDDQLSDRINSLFGTARVIVSGVFGQRRKKLVLVVERDRNTLNFINGLLAKVNRHCEVVRVSDGADAFATACSRQPDLIIANPVVEGVNGFRLIDNLRMDPQVRRIAVLLTTGLTSAALLTNLLTSLGGRFSQGALG